MTDYAGFWLGFFAFLAIMTTFHTGGCGKPTMSQAIIYKMTLVKNWQLEKCKEF